MIFVSSCAVRADTIKEAVVGLAEQGITNIELTGGTKYYEGFDDDLLHLRDKYHLTYQVHNYFPPPEKDFILNFASLDQETYERSINHGVNAIEMCKKLSLNRYSFHAGFLIDFSTREIGKKIQKRKLYDREKALKRFNEAVEILSGEAGEDIALYVENNVLSSVNIKTYEGVNPFLLTDYQGYLELTEELNINLLLDLAHLKVSTKSLGKDFSQEVNQMINLTDYLHVSGNDGNFDQNLGIEFDEDIIKALSNACIKDKNITLEIYSGLENVKSSIELIESLQSET